MSKNIALSFVFLVCAGVSFEALCDENIDLGKIVITPSRTQEAYSETSQNVDVIELGGAAQAHTKDVAEILSPLASVNISNYGGIGATKTLRIRGSSAAQVLVLVDGRPVTSPRDGEADLSTLPMDNIERVEVVHGPSASLYGTGAMGGTVNILTKDPPKDTPETQVTSSYGSFNTFAERLSHGARIKNFGYLVSAGYQSSRGFRDNSEFNAKDFNTKFNYRLNDAHSFNLQTGFYTNTSGTPGPITSPDSDDKQKVLKNNLNLGWDYAIDDTTELSTRTYENYDRLEFMENSAGSMFDIPFDKFIHTTSQRGSDITLRKQFSENYQALVGFDYQYNKNDSTSTAKHNYNVKAWFLENKLNLFKKLNLNLSARLDDYSNFGTTVNPSLAASYTLPHNIKLHGLVAQSFRAPTFNDLYWPDQGWAKGNPELTPEKGLTKEIGVEAQITDRVTTGITYYRNDFDDLISWVDRAGVWQPVNVGEAVIDGVELSNIFKLTDSLGVNLSYTYLSAKDKITHNYLVYRPKDKIDLALQYKHPKGFACELRGQFTSRRFHNEENTVYAKRFFVMSLSASQKINKNLTCFLTIDNLTDRNYQEVEFYPMPPISWTTGITLKF